MIWRKKQAGPERPEREERPFGKLSDAALQQQALSVASDREATITEALFRTRDALLDSQDATNDLTASIQRLTYWLVIITVVIGALTVVMAWSPLSSVGSAVWHFIRR